MPAALDRLVEVVKHSRVPGDPVVPVVPSQLQRKRSMLLAYWRMAVLAAPPTDLADRPIQAICGCLALDHPVPTPGLRPVMGEAQQIECPTATRGQRIIVRLSFPWLVEVDQSGLLRVQT